MAFLSLLDERLKPKGSRDPLGFEQVWTKFGRPGCCWKLNNWKQVLRIKLICLSIRNLSIN